MMKLLVLRGVPLLIRPAVVLFEGVLGTSDRILALALPLAMMALMISSIPVHLDYFKSSLSNGDNTTLGKNYVSALTWVCIIALVIFAPVLAFLPLDLSATLLVAICLLFLVEKLADEVARTLEFRKKFIHWFLVQSLRSGWLAVPIVLAFVGLSYEMSFLLLSGATCISMLVLYKKITGLTPWIGKQGLMQMRTNTVFFIGAFLPASYQQLPRIVVAKIYPDEANIFLAVAQLAQSVGLLFNVRFQIPYRRLIARRPKAFQRLLAPVMRQLLIASGLVAALNLAIPKIINPEHLSDIVLGFLLAPILMANALTFAVLSANLGYLQWFADKKKALSFYVVCAVIALLVACVGVILGGSEGITIFAVPSLVIIVGLAWLLLAERLFFGRAAP